MPVDTALPEASETTAEIRSVHVHLARAPYCKSWSHEQAEDRAQTFASEQAGGVVVGIEGPFDYTSAECPWKQEQECFDEGTAEPEAALPEPEETEETEEPETSAEIADAVIEAIPELSLEAIPEAASKLSPQPLVAIPLSECHCSLGSECDVCRQPVNLETGEVIPSLTPARAATILRSLHEPTSEPSTIITTMSGPPLASAPPTAVAIPSGALMDIVCDECGKPLGEHSHPVRGGGVIRPMGPRKKPEERPPCPHCGGPIHWNDSGGKVNFECLFRQMFISKGLMKDPQTERLPVATAQDFIDLGNWVASTQASAGPLKYGKMESAVGGAATYSGLRSLSRPPSEPKEPKPAKAPKPAKSITAATHEAVVTRIDNMLTGAPELSTLPEPEAKKKLTKEEKRAQRQEKLKQIKKK